jgi:hypothetical protein
MFHKILYGVDTGFICRDIQVMNKLHRHCLIHQHQRHKHYLDTVIVLMHYTKREDIPSHETIPYFNKYFFQASFFFFCFTITNNLKNYTNVKYAKICNTIPLWPKVQNNMYNKHNIPASGVPKGGFQTPPEIPRF